MTDSLPQSPSGEEPSDQSGPPTSGKFSIFEPQVLVSGTEFEISWEEVPAATGYDFTISTNKDCSKPIFILQNVPSLSYKASMHSAGNFYICVSAHLVGGGILEATNNGMSLNIAPPNVPPEFSFVEPDGNGDTIAAGGSFNITWTDSDPDDDASIQLYYKIVASGSCETGTVIPGSVSEDADGAMGAKSWDTAGVSPGIYYICALVTDGSAPGLEVWSAHAVRINAPPAFSFIEPDGSGDSIAVNSSFNITWTDSDPDSDATIQLFYKSSATGTCDSGIAIPGTVSEDADGTSGSLSWNATGLGAGSFYFCANISDGIAPAVEIWSANAITINALPALAFDALPARSVEGSDITISWTDSDPDSSALVGLYWKTTNSGACTSGGTLIGGNIAEDDPTNTLLFDTSGMASGSYYICAVIDDSINSAVEIYSGSFVVYHVCTWTGNSDTVWGNAANWDVQCGSVAPQSVDEVIIPAGAASQPVITTSTTISGFSSGVGGGTVTVNAGMTLTTTSESEAMMSSVAFQGDTPSCSTCTVSTTQDFVVKNNAVLKLLTGVNLYVNMWSKSLRIGDGASPGHLMVLPGSVVTAEWPDVSAGNLIIIAGAGSAQKSTVTIDGLNVTSAMYFRFNDHYQIDQFDHINFIVGFPGDGKDMVVLSNCTNAVVNDLTWSTIFFDSSVRGQSASTTNNIDAFGCAGIGPVSVSGGGKRYGSMFENDPNNLFTWTSEPVSRTCEWTGSLNTNWSDPGNWINCGAVTPGSIDWVVIPSTAVNQPEVTVSTEFQGFAPGTGGGTVTLTNASILLQDYTQTIRSDITFTSNTAYCSGCYIWGGFTIAVTDGAKLTLGNNVKLAVDLWAAYLNIGNNTTSGHLQTSSTETNPDLWPKIINSHPIAVNGVSALNRSTIELDRVSIESLTYTNQNAVEFNTDFEIKRFRNVVLTRTTNLASKAVISFVDCTNSLISDYVWSNLTFNGHLTAPTAAISAAGSGCDSTVINGSLTINVSGWGSYFNLELDPNGIINWVTPACGGVSSANYCWYLADEGDSCESKCSLNGGYNPGTKHYLSRDLFGNDSTRCSAIADLLLTPTPAVEASYAGAYLGCYYESTSNQTYFNTNYSMGRTRANASAANVRPLCACNQ